MSKKVTEMIQHAHDALKNAYAPYSNFKVAACISTEDGQLFVGVNAENSAYPLGICAESSAICQMITAGHQRIKDLVIIASSKKLCAPCGGCRQRIYEFSMPGTTVHLCNEKGVLQSLTIDELLPLAFKLP